MVAQVQHQSSEQNVRCKNWHHNTNPQLATAANAICWQQASASHMGAAGSASKCLREMLLHEPKRMAEWVLQHASRCAQLIGKVGVSGVKPDSRRYSMRSIALVLMYTMPCCHASIKQDFCTQSVAL